MDEGSDSLEFIELKAQLKLINDVAQIGFWQYDIEKSFLEWNHAMFSIYGRSGNWFENKFENWQECVLPEDLAAAEKEFQHCISIGKNYVYSFRIRTEAGEVRHISATAMAIKNKQGQTIKMVGVNQDITVSERLKELERERSRHLSAFIEQSPNATAMVDQNMVYLAASKKWLSDYGVLTDVIGKSHYEIFPEIGEDWKSIHRRCLKGDVDVATEQPFYREDGSVQYLNWDVRPWYDENNAVGGILMSTEEVTERVKAQKEKENILSILKETQSMARIGVWEVDLVAGSTTWDDMVYEIHEITRAEHSPKIASGLHFYKEGLSRDTITQVFNKCISDREPFDVELELITAKCNEIWVRSIGYPVITEQGDVIAVNGLFQDITVTKKNELTLIDAKKKLQVLADGLTVRNKSLYEFAHIASHNLRAPIGNIGTLLGMLNTENEPERRAKLIAMINTASQNVQETLTALIDSLIIREESLNVRETVYLEQVFEKCLNQFQGLIEQTGASISANFEGFEEVSGNTVYFESIFSNLISNALKYRNPDKKPVIEVKTRQWDDQYQISFADNGLGIDLKRHGAKIFGLQKTFHRNKDAKGIGLFLIKSQVEAMGGSIEVESEVLQGSTFTVTFKNRIDVA